MKKPWQWKRTVFKALVVLVFGIMFFRWFEHSQVYHPTKDWVVDPAELGRPFENVFFKSSDGVELNGWFFPGNTNSTRARIVMLICHGNGGNVSHRIELYEALLEIGVSVFGFDYRGYGRSQGRPGEEGTYRDAQAAYQWLRQKGFAEKNIIAYGESLGGGIASELALRERVAALVLQSTFTSIPEIGAEVFPWLPVRLLGSIEYDTRGKLPRLKIPVLVMHSRGDGLARYHHAEKNFAAANEPKFFCELQGEHNEAVWEQPEYKAAMEKFLKLLEAESAIAAPVS